MTDTDPCWGCGSHENVETARIVDDPDPDHYCRICLACRDRGVFWIEPHPVQN